MAAFSHQETTPDITLHTKPPSSQRYDYSGSRENFPATGFNEKAYPETQQHTINVD